MTELSANIRLRPTRIGFLVRPKDISSIRKIMRINACLWGGMYNPIIPVFKTAPKEWQGQKHESVKGYNVAKGYVRFFEPDVYVEAEAGLLEKAGLEEFQKNSIMHRQSVSLKEFMSREYHGRIDPVLGQSVFDILRHAYENERRFVMRDEHPAIAASGLGDIFAELCIGVYPSGKDTKYLSRAYKDVYKPEQVASDVKTWLKIYKDRLVTPLRVTDKHLEKQRFWHHEPIIYIFDPQKAIDIIDLWNLRIEPSPVFPVPIGWLEELSGFLKEMITKNHRPLKGNPYGVMHHTSVQLARSLSEEQYKNVVIPALAGTPQESWRPCGQTPLWHAPFNYREGPDHERMKVTAAEKRENLIVIRENSLRTEFKTLSPLFADRFAGSKSRWVNVVVPRAYRDNEIAVVLPYNTFDRRWPRLGMGGERVNIHQEGWAFTQDHKDWSQPIYLLRHDEAFTQWFKNLGVKARLSEPGRIAKQMLNSLGGFWGLHLVDTPEVIQLLNNMALSTRKRANNVDVAEDEFRARTAPLKDWFDLLSKRLQAQRLPELKVSDYTKRKVIRLGLEIGCSHCGAKNWYGLDTIDYEVICEQCLKHYDFPQADLQRDNKNWKYRVIGPFASPDYARGAYSALLAINALRNIPTLEEAINYSTALELSSANAKCEIDFAMWSANESKHDIYGNPKLVIGEAKSFAIEAIKPKDIRQLKIAAKALPEAVIVISVLKNDFSTKEKKLLKSFVEWARESKNYRPKHWVILFTGTELFAEHYIGETWKKKGEPYSKFAEHHTSSLKSLAEATQAIYLGMPSYYTWKDAKRKQAREKAK